MPRIAPFEAETERYERWFETHPEAYRSETAALSRFVPADAFAVAVGVGTGRFAAPLDVEVGVDPSPAMLDRAVERGVRGVRGVAEALPLGADRFDLALLVTTICFVDDIQATLVEARRVLHPGGSLVIGYVDADSPLGRRYRERKDENPFYRDATFVSTRQLIEALEDAGFVDVAFVQTIFEFPEEMDAPAPVHEGYGDGSYVALRAVAGE